ncbi:MAG: hydroxymethylbilane synthase [Caldilineaceae bacterium]
MSTVASLRLSSTLTLGTRTSELALWQTNHVIQLLQAAWPALVCQITPFVTQGDKTQASGKPLLSIGGKGLFTLELEEALRSGTIDLAVHSLKDLPVEDAPGLTIGAISSRADVRDVFVARNGWTLATLPPNAIVGTSSTRRAAQLLLARPDLQIKSIRGNVGTRVRKVLDGDYDATVLAAAGLERLGLSDAVTEKLSLEVMLPAPGQGALAVQCRAEDKATLALLAAIDDVDVRAAVTAERQFLHDLGGGCSAPVAAYATVVDAPKRLFQMQALVASPDGQRVVRVQGAGEAATLGSRLAQQALAQGVASLLNAPPALPSNQNGAQSAPLQNKRIVVTRAREQATELCCQLTNLGATPLLMPMIKIAPVDDLTALDQAIQALETYDWLIFTSTNTVTVFWDRWTALKGKACSATQKVAAVGSATADALRQHGIEPAFVPDQFVAAKIATGLGDIRGVRILLPQAEIARPELADMLHTQGAQVDAVPVYQTLPVILEQAAVAALQQGVDVILFTSPSTVQNFCTALRQQGLDPTLLQQSQIACIGPVTAQAAQDLGLPVALVADEATVEGLVQTLVTHFRSDDFSR